MDIEAVFENLPNFRQAGGQKLMNRNGQMIKDGLLYRSSRTDFLEEKEKAIFQKLQIKAIIDLRRKTEYERAEGEKLLDDLYTPCVVEKGKMEEMKPSFRWGGKLRKRKTAQKDPDSTDAPFPGRRYLINMMTMDLIWYIFGQVNFFIRYLSLVLLLVDWLCGCHIFMKFFAWAVVNRMSLAQQYVDMLEYTKPAVADILRVIIEEDNVPVLIHCAHGKDRTGVIIGVILGCLEVDDDIIAEDYAKSEAGLAPIKDRLHKETVQRFGFKEEFMKADSETMREVLRELRKRYGSISSYLESAGFTLEEQNKLKEIFLLPKECEDE